MPKVFISQKRSRGSGDKVLTFVGAGTTTQPSAGDYIKTTINNTTYYVSTTNSGALVEVEAKVGQMIIVGKKEYVCVVGGYYGVNSFTEMGDESAYAHKSITLTAGTGLTGGGNLEADRTFELASAYGDTLNPYGSKTANYVLASPNGENGVPVFRPLVATDIPDLSATYLTSHQDIKTINGVSILGTGDVAIDEIAYSTTEPTEDNTSGKLKIVVLDAEPSQRFSGYLYIINGSI